jgi:hypothetical protein
MTRSIVMVRQEEQADEYIESTGRYRVSLRRDFYGRFGA